MTPKDGELDADVIEGFREMVRSEGFDALEWLYPKLDPFVLGMETARKAVVLSLASNDIGVRRGRIHTLLIGPPGTAKSDIRNFVKNHLGAVGVGPKSSEAGLKYDARGEGTPGALNMADQGILAIEELEKFSNPERDALLESMAEGYYDVTTGTKRITLPARVRVVACCNTTKALSDALLDRFDFKIEVKVPSKQAEKEITDYIYDRWFDTEEMESAQLLRNYLAWVRPYVPEVNAEVMGRMKVIKNVFIDQVEKKPNIREKESFLRTAITIAKLNRRPVSVEDYLEGVKLQNPALPPKSRDALRI